MSKKSRKRNKKILAVLGALGGAALMAKRKRDASNSVVEANDNAFDIPAVTSTPKKKPTAVVTGTNYPGENKAKVFPKLKVSDKGYVTKDGVAQGFTGKGKFVSDDGVFVKGKKVSETAPKGILVRKDGTIKAGGNEYYNKAQYSTRNDKPAMLGDSGFTAPRTYNAISPFQAKDGGRAKLKSGGKVKGCGKALRGFGRAMKKGKK
jgi:hypothetical protein